MYLNPLSPRDALKHNFTSPKTPNFPTARGFRKTISMKLVYQYMAILFYFSQLHSLQAKDCANNSRLVVDEDDNGKFRLERVKK